MKKEGKTLTIILVVFVIILLSVSGIFGFSLVKENELRKAAESSLEQLRGEKAKLEAGLKESEKQIFVLEEKKKEADNKIDGLMAEVDLERGLKEGITVTARVPVGSTPSRYHQR